MTAAPQFIDDPRPPKNDIRLWPILALVAVAFVVLGGGVLWATSASDTPKRRQEPVGQSIADPKPLNGLATDYLQVKQPPPPEPTAQVTEQVATPAPVVEDKPVRSSGGGGGSGQKSWREEAREKDVQLIEVARPSGQQQAAAQQEGGIPGAARSNPIFGKSKLNAPYPSQVSAGTPIRAHTEQPITTDAEGYVTAKVIGNVFTSDKKCVAIPDGSRLFGQTVGEVSEGQVRVNIAWTNLERPPPRLDSIELLNVFGADRDGTQGVRGSVNNHWLRKLGFVAMSSLIDVGTAALRGRGGNGGTAIILGDSVAQNARSPLDEFAKRQLDIPPTIEVEPKEISVMLSQHLPLDCFKK